MYAPQFIFFVFGFYSKHCPLCLQVYLPTAPLVMLLTIFTAFPCFKQQIHLLCLRLYFRTCSDGHLSTLTFSSSAYWLITFPDSITVYTLFYGICLYYFIFAVSILFPSWCGKADLQFAARVVLVYLPQSGLLHIC
jgi:hypothetical protein